MKGKERGGLFPLDKVKERGRKDPKKKIPARIMQTGIFRIGRDGASVEGYLVDEEESRIALGSVPFGY